MKRVKGIAFAALFGTALLTGCSDKEVSETVAETAVQEQTQAELKLNTELETDSSAEKDAETEITGVQGSDTGAETAAEEAVEEEGSEPEGDAYTYYINEVYKKELAAYETALKEEWDQEKYYENDMSPLAAYYYEGNALDNVGFALEDMDADGRYELLIGETSGTDPVIFEMYTAPDGEPKSVFTSYDRDRYYVEWLEEGAWMIANEGSSSAANSAWHYYILTNGKLDVMQAIVFDALADEQNPWFLAYDDDWDTGNDTPTDEEMAQSIIDSHTRCYTAPDYIPFSLYQG